MNLIEKILSNHTDKNRVEPGEIVDIFIDTRVARDFGGANVVKNLEANNLSIHDASKTFFTFDCNPGGSDQKYAANQHYCRQFARNNEIQVYDINAGIGTHLAIDRGLVYPGSTFVSTDSHANIMGAIGAFGQGMGDQDIAAVWAKGKAWFKVPHSVKVNFEGERPVDVSAKDIVLNMLSVFGANKLLGFSVELYGEAIETLTLDERITISSMATEMGAIIVLIPPSPKTLDELEKRSGKRFELIQADNDATYLEELTLKISDFKPMLASPGHPHDNILVENALNVKIDSAFIGSCTNGRIADLRIAAKILKGKKVAPGVVLKIVPSTDEIWNEALNEGLIKIFKDAGALVSNAGCAGCAAGQVGQNGPEEVTISTGNRNFSGKQGKGLVYLASPEIVAASSIAGYITTSNNIPAIPAVFTADSIKNKAKKQIPKDSIDSPTVVQGRVWYIKQDDIDTDMIFHNRYLTITDINEMGQYTFDNLRGYEDFSSKAKVGDIIITTKNFGAGSSRQQAVDCFKSLGIQCIIAESFGAIYERNAINAAFPILTYKNIDSIEVENGNMLKVDYINGTLSNLDKNLSCPINKFFDVQLEIYTNGGLL